MKFWAKLISRLFDPVVEVPLALAWLTSMAFLNGYRWRFLAAMFILDALIPAAFFIYLLAREKGFDWDIHNRKLREPLFRVVVVCHGLGVMVAYWLQRRPLAEMLLGLWGLAVIFAVVSRKWKISVHAGVNAAVITLVNLLLGRQYWWLYGVVGLVAWARVVHRDHTWRQVVVGALVPTILLPVWFWWWGII